MQTKSGAREASSDAFSRAAYAKKVLELHDERVATIARVPMPYYFSAPIVTGDTEVVKQKIGVIGAGMAGLYTALLLDSLGFNEYEILEANAERVGGRVFTRYFSDDKKKWNYIDYGAMRFPGIDIMDRVLGPQPWSLVNYLINKQGKVAINLLPYYLSDPNNIKYYNSTRRTVQEMPLMPDPLSFGTSNGGGVPDEYVAKPCQELLDDALKPYKDAMLVSFTKGFEKLLKVDHFSTRGLLRHVYMYPPQVIDYMEALETATSNYDEAFTESVIDSFEFDAKPDVKWWCVEGGTSKLPEAMTQAIRKSVEKGKKVIKIAHSLRSGKVEVSVDREAAPRVYDHVVNTVPPGVLRSMDTSDCNFSYDKRTALRALHVGSSVKIGLQFKSRWWQDGRFRMRGGQSSTDLPVRTIVYPSYGVDDKEAAGVLIASYAKAQDADRLGSIAADEERLVQLALANIAEVHGVTADYVKSQYTGEHYVQDWYQDEFSQGAFALFGPDQFSSLFGGLTSTEMYGRYHTAGEMASMNHAWIVGSLNSAWRCVYEILVASDAQKKIQELEEKWGWVDEVRRST